MKSSMLRYPNFISSGKLEVTGNARQRLRIMLASRVLPHQLHSDLDLAREPVLSRHLRREDRAEVRVKRITSSSGRRANLLTSPSDRSRSSGFASCFAVGKIVCPIKRTSTNTRFHAAPHPRLRTQLCKCSGNRTAECVKLPEFRLTDQLRCWVICARVTRQSRRRGNSPDVERWSYRGAKLFLSAAILNVGNRSRGSHIPPSSTGPRPSHCSRLRPAPSHRLAPEGAVRPVDRTSRIIPSILT